MINYFLSHKDQISGCIGGSGLILLDTINGWNVKHELIHDSHVICMLIIVLTIKAAYGAFAGILIGKIVAKFSKSEK